jgi:hypothetical protein
MSPFEAFPLTYETCPRAWIHYRLHSDVYLQALLFRFLAAIKTGDFMWRRGFLEPAPAISSPCHADATSPSSLGALYRHPRFVKSHCQSPRWMNRAASLLVGACHTIALLDSSSSPANKRARRLRPSPVTDITSPSFESPTQHLVYVPPGRHPSRLWPLRWLARPNQPWPDLYVLKVIRRGIYKIATRS